MTFCQYSEADASLDRKVAETGTLANASAVKIR